TDVGVPGPQRLEHGEDGEGVRSAEVALGEEDADREAAGLDDVAGGILDEPLTPEPGHVVVERSGDLDEVEQVAGLGERQAFLALAQQKSFEDTVPHAIPPSWKWASRASPVSEITSPLRMPTLPREVSRTDGRRSASGSRSIRSAPLARMRSPQ